jgi:hypothetical protein
MGPSAPKGEKEAVGYQGKFVRLCRGRESRVALRTTSQSYEHLKRTSSGWLHFAHLFQDFVCSLEGIEPRWNAAIDCGVQ